MFLEVFYVQAFILKYFTYPILNQETYLILS